MTGGPTRKAKYPTVATAATAAFTSRDQARTSGSSSERVPAMNRSKAGSDRLSDPATQASRPGRSGTVNPRAAISGCDLSRRSAASTALNRLTPLVVESRLTNSQVSRAALETACSPKRPIKAGQKHSRCFRPIESNTQPSESNPIRAACPRGATFIFISSPIRSGCSRDRRFPGGTRGFPPVSSCRGRMLEQKRHPES